jgi:hypothetical protein
MATLLQNPSVNPALVEIALQEILSSHYFHSSAQCSALLRYVVENTVNERSDCLRERVIGTEVFDRAPDYDTGNDHIVRSRASEVRKRLAQYYQETGSGAALRISIPSGSYRATFDLAPPSKRDPAEAKLELPLPRLEPPAEENLPTASLTAVESQTEVLSPLLETPRRSAASIIGWARIAIAAFLTICIAVGIVRSWPNAGISRFDTFWSPISKSSKPALIYCGGGFVYKLSDEYLDDYRLKHALKDTRREFFVDLKPGETVPGKDLIADKHFVPFGDLASAARIAATLSHFNKGYDLRYGDDMAFTEFHTSPVILIGGLNNSWALKVTHNLRYVLEQDDRIVDQWDRKKTWMQKADPDNQARDDFAIISRLNTSDAGVGSFVISIAGIRMYGTQAAADLISDPTRLNQILKDLPPSWERKNLQVVIHTRTMNEIPISVNVEAIHSW